MGGDSGGGRRGKVENAVRGRAPQSPAEWTIQREVVEHYLVTEGYQLDDLRGVEVEWTTVEDPHGIAASLGRVAPRSARVSAAGAVALGLLASAETGLLSPVPVSLAAAVALFAIGDLPDPDPVVKTHNLTRPGMSEREVYRRLSMTNEIAELEQEEREKARRKARRQSSTRTGGP